MPMPGFIQDENKCADSVISVLISFIETNTWLAC